MFKAGDHVRTTGYDRNFGIVLRVGDAIDTTGGNNQPDVFVRIADSEDTMWWTAKSVVLVEAVESRRAIDRDFNAYLAAERSENMPTPKEELAVPLYDFVNAPKHYNDHPSGVECQIIIRECKDPMISFAMKHLWRSQWGTKPGETSDRDLSKAVEYIQLEQARRAGVERLS